MKYHVLYLIPALFILVACEKSIPTSNTTELNDPYSVYPPPSSPPSTPPSPGITISSDCSHSWVCASNSQIPNISYGGIEHFNFFADGAAAVASNNIFFAGGHDEGLVYTGPFPDVNVYTPVSNSWQHTELSLARCRLSGVGIGNLVLFAGGNNSIATYPDYSTITANYASVLTYYNTVDIYNASTLSRQTANLSEARAYMASASYNGKAWFIGGRNNSVYLTTIDIYNPSDSSWSLKQLPRARAHGGAAVAGNELFVAGGKNEGGNLKIVDVYNESTGLWSTLTAPNEHPYASVVVLNDKIFIAGGDGVSNNTVDIYSIQSDTWTTIHLSDSRYNITVGVANNKIIFLGGNYSTELDVYNDQTGVLTPGNISASIYNGGTSGVTGIVCGCLNNTCYFAGVLYDYGNASTNTMIIMQP